MDTRLIRTDSLLCPRGKTAGLTFTLTSPQKKKKRTPTFHGSIILVSVLTGFVFLI